MLMVPNLEEKIMNTHPEKSEEEVHIMGTLVSLLRQERRFLTMVPILSYKKEHQAQGLTTPKASNQP